MKENNPSFRYDPDPTEHEQEQSDSETAEGVMPQPTPNILGVVAFVIGVWVVVPLVVGYLKIREKIRALRAS
jgi:hypothetical protein